MIISKYDYHHHHHHHYHHHLLYAGIRTHIPETNHVSTVCSVAAILRVLLMVHITLSSILKLFYASTLALSAVCVLCPI
jgi:hypothetical protein